jgi:hypothetical protein
MLNSPLHYRLMHAMARVSKAGVHRVCPSPQKGKEQARHRADLRKKQKNYDYILSSPQENGKQKTRNLPLFLL